MIAIQTMPMPGTRPAAERARQQMQSDSLAQNVKEFLDANLDRHVTIQQLSVMFHASQTQLKNSFKNEYGVSVYAYSRTQKMKDAAVLLRETGMTVIEIAGKYGYNNGSKFARAFRDVIGVSPKQYRMQTKAE